MKLHGLDFSKTEDGKKIRRMKCICGGLHLTVVSFLIVSAYKKDVFS